MAFDLLSGDYDSSGLLELPFAADFVLGLLLYCVTECMHASKVADIFHYHSDCDFVKFVI